MVGIFSTSVLVLLPGCWISALLPLRGLSFLTRIFLGFTFTPLVLYAEFVSLRAIGLSFESSAWILVLVNLPPLALMFHRWSGLQKMPHPKTFWLAAIVYLFTVFLYAINSGQEDIRINGGGHLWLRADIIYSLASGDFPPEERQIAGLQLAYPWAFYVQQALISYWLDLTHLSTYIWVNASWLLAASFFAVKITGQFSSSPITKALSLVFLYYGVNFVGFILMSVFPVSVGQWENTLWGDLRYTPWIIKYFNSTPMIPGIGSAIALLHALAQKNEKYLDWAILLVFLLLSTGIIYPLLLPAACAFVCSRIGVILVERIVFQEKPFFFESINLLTVLALGIIISFLHLEYLLQDRTQDGMLHLSSILGMGRKLIEDGVVLSVLLIGCVLVFHRCWKTARPLTLLLLLGALASVFLNVVLSIPGFRNEYKYIFPAAMCLFSFPALAFEHRILKRKFLAIPFVLLTCLILAFPLYGMRTDIPQLKLDVSGFRARLADDEPLAPVLDAIRTSTPIDTILVLDRWDFYWPTLTGRSMYVSPSKKQYLQGTNILTDLHLKEAGGYGKDLIEGRRAIVDNLYSGTSDQERMEGLQKIGSLGRSIVIIFDLDRHQKVLGWLKDNNIGRTLIENGRSLAWLVKDGVI